MHTVYDRPARNYIPCLGQTRAKLYTLFRTERTKTIPCLPAHPRIGHIREYPPPLPPTYCLIAALFIFSLNLKEEDWINLT